MTYSCGKENDNNSSIINENVIYDESNYDEGIVGLWKCIVDSGECKFMYLGTKLNFKIDGALLVDGVDDGNSYIIQGNKVICRVKGSNYGSNYVGDWFSIESMSTTQMVLHDGPRTGSFVMKRIQ
jgi:hypothetical protein